MTSSTAALLKSSFIRISRSGIRAADSILGRFAAKLLIRAEVLISRRSASRLLSRAEALIPCCSAVKLSINFPPFTLLIFFASFLFQRNKVFSFFLRSIVPSAKRGTARFPETTLVYMRSSTAVYVPAVNDTRIGIFLPFR